MLIIGSMTDLFLRILSLKAEKSRSIGCRLSIKPLYFFCLGGWCALKLIWWEGTPLGASKIPIGKRGDVPLLVPVRHKPVLGSLHLGVVMACTTLTTSCQGRTETNFSGMDATVERCQMDLPNFLTPKSCRMMRAQVVVATLGVLHQARLHQSVHQSSADQKQSHSWFHN